MMISAVNSMGVAMSTIVILLSFIYLGYLWVEDTRSRLAIYAVGFFIGFLIREILILGNPF